MCVDFWLYYFVPHVERGNGDRKDDDCFVSKQSDSEERLCERNKIKNDISKNHLKGWFFDAPTNSY